MNLIWAFLAGIIQLINKLFDKFVPGRVEGIRTRIEEIKREQKKLISEPPTVANTKRFDALASELQRLQAQLANREAK